MKFLIDMPLSPKLALWLSHRGHDAVHAVELGLAQASDIIILEHAQKEQRVIITADLDYPRLLALAKAEEPGLILFRGGNYSRQEIIERLTRVFELIPGVEILNSIIVIEKNRIRRRFLPINSKN
jgi:predicted nuclease of predicted toxin-antitoxin system